MNDFDDVILPESNSKHTIIKIFIVLIIIGGFFVLFHLYQKNNAFNIKKNVVFEVGSTFNRDVSLYISNNPNNPEDYTITFQNDIPLSDDILTEIGKYTFEVKYKNLKKSGTFEVKDSVAPQVKVEDVIIGVDEEYLLDDFITSCEDYSKPCDIKYKNENDSKKSSKAGIYSFDIIISDQAGNSVTKTVKLEVRENFSRDELKTTDLKWNHTDPEFSDFDGTLALSYSAAFSPDDHDNPRMQYYYEMVEANHSNYLPSGYEYRDIEEETIMTVYNKYHYIIGFAIRAKLDNGKIVYLEEPTYTYNYDDEE